MVNKKFAKNTKNESFINKWHDLQNKGISNNSFMLRVANDKLINYDKTKSPEDNDTDLATLIAECSNNVWFFFREILRIPAAFFSRNNYIKNSPEFFLTETSAEMIYGYEQGISMTIYSPDTEGKTTLLRALFLYTILIGKFNTMYISKNPEHDIERLKNIIDANSIIGSNMNILSMNLSDYVVSPNTAYNKLSSVACIEEGRNNPMIIFVSSFRNNLGMDNDYANIMSIISGNRNMIVYEESSMKYRDPGLTYKIYNNLRFVNVVDEWDVYDNLDINYFRNTKCKQSVLITKDL